MIFTDTNEARVRFLIVYQERATPDRHHDQRCRSSATRAPNSQLPIRGLLSLPLRREKLLESVDASLILPEAMTAILNLLPTL